MSELCYADELHLQAAEGWLGLDEHVEAAKELDEISPLMRVHPRVLSVRWMVYSHHRALLQHSAEHASHREREAGKRHGSQRDGT